MAIRVAIGITSILAILITFVYCVYIVPLLIRRKLRESFGDIDTLTVAWWNNSARSSTQKHYVTTLYFVNETLAKNEYFHQAVLRECARGLQIQPLSALSFSFISAVIARKLPKSASNNLTENLFEVLTGPEVLGGQRLSNVHVNIQDTVSERIKLNWNVPQIPLS